MTQYITQHYGTQVTINSRKRFGPYFVVRFGDLPFATRCRINKQWYMKTGHNDIIANIKGDNRGYGGPRKVIESNQMVAIDKHHVPDNVVIVYIRLRGEK